MSRHTDAIRVTMESIETSIPNNRLTVSNEGMKGAILGFLYGSAMQIIPVGGGAIAGTVVEMECQKLKRDIVHIAKQLEALREKDVKEATRIGLRSGHQSAAGHLRTHGKKISWTEVIAMAFAGAILSPITVAFQGHEYEELQKELASKLVELKLAYKKAGVNIQDDEN